MPVVQSLERVAAVVYFCQRTTSLWKKKCTKVEGLSWKRLGEAPLTPRNALPKHFPLSFHSFLSPPFPVIYKHLAISTTIVRSAQVWEWNTFSGSGVTHADTIGGRNEIRRIYFLEQGSCISDTEIGWANHALTLIGWYFPHICLWNKMRLCNPIAVSQLPRNNTSSHPTPEQR